MYPVGPYPEFIEKKQDFPNPKPTKIVKHPKHSRWPEDLRKCTRQRAKSLFSVSWGALESFLLQLSSLSFARTSTVSCEAAAEFVAGSEDSRCGAGPGSLFFSKDWAGSKWVYLFSPSFINLNQTLCSSAVLSSDYLSRSVRDQCIW